MIVNSKTVTINGLQYTVRSAKDDDAKDFDARLKSRHRLL